MEFQLVTGATKRYSCSGTRKGGKTPGYRFAAYSTIPLPRVYRCSSSTLNNLAGNSCTTSVILLLRERLCDSVDKSFPRKLCRLCSCHCLQLLLLSYLRHVEILRIHWMLLHHSMKLMETFTSSSFHGTEPPHLKSLQANRPLPGLLCGNDSHIPQWLMAVKHLLFEPLQKLN